MTITSKFECLTFLRQLRRSVITERHGDQTESDAELSLKAKNALDTVIDNLTAQSEQEFKTILNRKNNYRNLPSLLSPNDDERDQRRTPPSGQGGALLRLITCLAIVLYSMHGFAQYDTSIMKKCDPYLLRSFTFSYCNQIADTLYSFEALPTLIRSHAVGKAYEQSETIPFRVFWTPPAWSASLGLGYEVQKGACRGFSVSIPCAQRGVYSVVFDHPERPSFMQITVGTADDGRNAAALRFFENCRKSPFYGKYFADPVTLNFPPGPVTVTTFFRTDDGGGYAIPDDVSKYRQVAQTVTSDPENFKAEMPHVGLYIFRFEHPKKPLIYEELIRFAANGWESNSLHYHKAYKKS
jgi:hypothetical protein